MAISITDGSYTAVRSAKCSGMQCKLCWLVCLVAGAKKGSKGSISKDGWSSLSWHAMVRCNESFKGGRVAGALIWQKYV
jgi:hypothetical protein